MTDGPRLREVAKALNDARERLGASILELEAALVEFGALETGKVALPLAEEEDDGFGALLGWRIYQGKWRFVVGWLDASGDVARAQPLAVCATRVRVCAAGVLPGLLADVADHARRVRGEADRAAADVEVMVNAARVLRRR